VAGRCSRRVSHHSQSDPRAPARSCQQLLPVILVHSYYSVNMREFERVREKIVLVVVYQ
jgi:hypothetical protein